MQEEFLLIVFFFFFWRQNDFFFRKTENFLCWQQNPIFSSKLIRQTYFFFSTLLRTSKSSKTSFQKICYHEEFCLVLEGTFSLWYVMLSSLLSCWFMYSFFWIQILKFLKREKKVNCCSYLVKGTFFSQTMMLLLKAKQLPPCLGEKKTVG